MTATMGVSQINPTLSAADSEMFLRIGVGPDLLDAAGVRRVTDNEARERLGVTHRGDLAGILFPRRDPVSGQDRGYRLRRDHPDVDSAGAPIDKYLSSLDRSTLFWPPSCASLLPDTSVTVVLVESERATLALVAAATQRGRALLVVGLGGCWGFRGRIGKSVDATGARVDEKGVLPDIDRIAWTDRDVVVLFDANVATNSKVQAARRELARELRQRHARVRLLTLRQEPGVNGPDDFLALHGPAELFARMDAMDDDVETDRGGRDSQATQIVQLARAAAAEWFHDDDQAYVHVRDEACVETYPLRSRQGRGWLQRLFLNATRKCPGGQAITDAINTLEADALRGPARTVAVRIAPVEGAVYLDLADPMRRIVEITATGWQVVTDAPVRFRRTKGQKPLPVPQGGADLTALRRFVNLTEDDFILLVAFLVGCLRGAGPYPALVVNGEQGSAKSTLTKICKALIDPTVPALRSEPRDARDLMIAATNTHLLAFDNCSQVSPWLSDAFCRLATGGGFATRTLYENREEEIFEAVRPVILNGITELATRPDLISRALVLALPTLADDQRREESTFWAEFEEIRPRLLGALYDAVSVALGRRGRVRLATKPRMADFAIWVSAAEPACPWEAGAFLRTYAGNRREAEEAALDGDPLADLVRTLAVEEWTGTAQELLVRLNQAAPEAVQRQSSWYRQPRQVKDALRRVAPALRQAGTAVDFLPRRGHRRPIWLHTRLAQGGADASSASPASSEPDVSAIAHDDDHEEGPAASSPASPHSRTPVGADDARDDDDDANVAFATGGPTRG